MYWSAVPFGKYQGHTLVEIVVRDPDWFFWMVPKLYGKLGRQAQDLARRIQAIKIPKSHAERWQVEYRYDCDQRFRGFELVRAGSTLFLPRGDPPAAPGFDLAASPKALRQAGWSYRGPGFSAAILWRAPAADQAAVRRVFQQ